VPGSRTTRCCSALALIAFCSIAFAARPPAPVTLVPVLPVWTLALNNSLVSAPAYDERHAYFAIEGDRIAAYDLIPGSLSWIANAHPTSAPVAGGGFLFFVEPGILTALHASDGSLAWQLPFAEPLAGNPVWDNGWLVLATKDGAILAFRATDGQLIWRRELSSPVHAAPALAADRIYVPVTDSRIVALNVTTGEPQWERRLGGAPAEILALEDRLYVGSNDNFFYCVIAKDGRVDWRWRTGGDIVGKPVADEHRVYFVALDNVLRALDRVSGGQKWLRALPLRPIWGPVLAGATIVVGGQANSLRAYNMSDGVATGEVSAGAEIAAAPHAFQNPTTRLPMVVMVTRDMVKGAGVTLVSRSIEPVISPVAPLANPVTLAPTLPVAR
jgi:outer membrane protein assembly factor BamB